MTIGLRTEANGFSAAVPILVEEKLPPDIRERVLSARARQYR